MLVVIHGINVSPLIADITTAPTDTPARMALQRPGIDFSYCTLIIWIESQVLKLNLWLPLHPVLLAPFLKKAHAEVHSL